MTILVIVESPGKVKKISSYLGSGYEVMASVGHIRGLDPKNMSIDFENNYQPLFIENDDKKEVIGKLKKAIKKSSKVILASDRDNEGEAIALSVAEVCGIKPADRHRATFTEITKKAITEAISKPTTINMDVVHAQFARMVLDKIVGYKICPLLWKEYCNFHLSSGRVQSVVVKLIVEREAEIEKFASESYFKINANFVLDKKDLDSKKKKTVCNYLETVSDENIKEQTTVENIYNNCASKVAKYIIKSLSKNNSKRNPSPPFITSTLQQDASAKLGMSPDVCMKTAQKLYEAGLITYMRTDAFYMADDAHKAIKGLVETKWGENYYRRVNYKTKSANAQEGHEACRPTDINKESVFGIEGMSGMHNNLYRLIWRRTVASQMSPADVEIRTVKISGDGKEKITFVGKHEKVIFEGFLAVMNLHKKAKKTNDKQNSDGTEVNNSSDEDDDCNDIETDEEENADDKIENSEYLEKIFDDLKEGTQVWPIAMDTTEKFTKPPNTRFTEASLIKKMDDLGIGRPSTYSSTIKKIQEDQRQYVERKSTPAKKVKITTMKYSYPDVIKISKVDTKIEGDKNKLFPTPLGIMINEYLTKNFTEIINYEFTAMIETQLDEIAQGDKIWYKVVDAVYLKLNPIVDALSKATSARKALKAENPGADSATRRFLGNNPSTDLPVYAIKSRKGLLVVEENPEKSLSRFGSFMSKFESMTLEKALELIVFPKNLGKYNNHEIIVKKAKNIYLCYNEKNYSIDSYLKAHKDNVFDPECINLENAINVLKHYEQSDKDRVENESRDKVLSEDITLKTGRFGPYIKYKGTVNIPLPKALRANWERATLEECQAVIDKNGSKIARATPKPKSAPKEKEKKEPKEPKPKSAGKEKKETKEPKPKSAAKEKKKVNETA